MAKMKTTITHYSFKQINSYSLKIIAIQIDSTASFSRRRRDINSQDVGQPASATSADGEVPETWLWTEETVRLG